MSTTARPRLAVTSPSFAKSAELMAELAKFECPITANSDGRQLAGQALIEFLNTSRASIAIVGRESITTEVLAACPELKFIAKYGVGLDNIDEAALKQFGVKLGWTAGVNKRSVAELVVGFALGHCRNIIPSMTAMRAGRWEKNGGRQLSNMTVGIVGFGHTGSEVARLSRAFGCKILYADIVDKSNDAVSLGAIAATYTEILQTAEIVTFHVPLTAQTKGMLSDREITHLRRDALVINTSRGEVVDFNAVCHAVESGKLGGFAADVYEIEPCDLSARTHPNLYFTPHIGGNAVEAVRAMGMAAVGWIQQALGGVVVTR